MSPARVNLSARRKREDQGVNYSRYDCDDDDVYAWSLSHRKSQCRRSKPRIHSSVSGLRRVKNLDNRLRSQIARPPRNQNLMRPNHSPPYHHTDASDYRPRTEVIANRFPSEHHLSSLDPPPYKRHIRRMSTSTVSSSAASTSSLSVNYPPDREELVVYPKEHDSQARLKYEEKQRELRDRYYQQMMSQNSQVQGAAPRSDLLPERGLHMDTEPLKIASEYSLPPPPMRPMNPMPPIVRMQSNLQSYPSSNMANTHSSILAAQPAGPVLPQSSTLLSGTHTQSPPPQVIAGMVPRSDTAEAFKYLQSTTPFRLPSDCYSTSQFSSKLRPPNQFSYMNHLQSQVPPRTCHGQADQSTFCQPSHSPLYLNQPVDYGSPRRSSIHCNVDYHIKEVPNKTSALPFHPSSRVQPVYPMRPSPLVDPSVFSSGKQQAIRDCRRPVPSAAFPTHVVPTHIGPRHCQRRRHREKKHRASNSAIEKESTDDCDKELLSAPPPIDEDLMQELDGIASRSFIYEKRSRGADEGEFSIERVPARRRVCGC